MYVGENEESEEREKERWSKMEFHPGPKKATKDLDMLLDSVVEIMLTHSVSASTSP